MEEAIDLLKTWELPELIPIFTEQEITIQALSALNNEDFKELIPRAGPRALFMRCWKSWKAEFSSENISNLDFSMLDVQTLDNLDPKDVIVLQNPLENVPPNNVDGEGLQTTTSTQCQILENLLKASLDTASLLTFKGRSLPGDNSRNLLASVIAKSILNENKDTTIRGATYYQWANHIKELFPGERTTTFYIPACTTANGVVLQARGKLVHQVLNKRRRLQDLGALPKGKRSREESPASSSRSYPSPRPLPDIFLNEDIDDNVEDDLQWLENSSDPWSIVKEKWKNTCKVRTRSLHDLDQSIESYFEKYPALKKPLGFVLLQSDFDGVHEMYKDNLFINFPVIKLKLQELVRKKTATDEFSLELLRLTDSSNEEISNLAGFLAIPYLLKTSTIRQRRKKICSEGENWKPSKIEVREGFIKHVKSDAEVGQTIELRLKVLQKKGVPSHPYIIVVGESLHEIKSYLIVANRYVMYECMYITHAVNSCYKIIWALNLQYGKDTYPVWYFIQKGLYKMSSMFDKGSTTAESLLTDCGVST